MHGTIDLHL